MHKCNAFIQASFLIQPNSIRKCSGALIRLLIAITPPLTYITERCQRQLHITPHVVGFRLISRTHQAIIRLGYACRQFRYIHLDATVKVYVIVAKLLIPYHIYTIHNRATQECVRNSSKKIKNTKK